MRKASEILYVVFEDIITDVKDYKYISQFTNISLIVFTFEGDNEASGVWYHSDIKYNVSKVFKIIRNENI